MELTISAADPIEHAEEIKQLFLANQRPEFPEYFDRAYPLAGRGRVRSWLGRDGDGRVVMHVARFDRQFSLGADAICAGLLANMMVDGPYRTFFPACSLIIRAVADSRTGGGVDLLFTDPNATAQAVLRSLGFAQVGTLDRLVCPIGDRRWPVDAGIRVFHGLLANRQRWSRRLQAVQRLATEYHPGELDRPQGESSRLRPWHSRELYAARIKGYPGSAHRWFSFAVDDASSQVGAVLIEGPDDSAFCYLRALRGMPGVSVSAWLPALVKELRHLGCARLQTGAVADSALGRELTRSGFFRRDDAVPLLAFALTPKGAAAMATPAGWELSDIDCDR